MWGLWLSRGACGILCTDMKTLRFLCFASLLALILLAGPTNQGGTAADIESSKPPIPEDLPGFVATENRHEIESVGNKSSGTIMITMTGIVGDPGDLGVE